MNPFTGNREGVFLWGEPAVARLFRKRPAKCMLTGLLFSRFLLEIFDETYSLLSGSMGGVVA